jgi:hypothetical protein
MQKPRDKGDYGVTPTDEEKSRLNGQDQSGPTSLNTDKKQNGTAEDPEDEANVTNTENTDAGNRVTTLPQEEGRG